MSSPETFRRARHLAFLVLDEHKRTGRFAAPILNERATAVAATPEERAAATELVYGTIRRRATLDALLEPIVKRPRHAVEGRLWTLLQLGMYQQVFLESVPEHAAVDETVELGRSSGRPRWTSFLNAVLRATPTVLGEGLADGPAADTLPLTGGRYRKLQQPVFADPVVDPGPWFARAMSFPDWLAARWTKRHSLEELVRLGFWFNDPPLLWLRANRLRTTRDELLASLTAAGVGCEAGTVEESLRLTAPAAVERLPGFEGGEFSVQDESAMHAARLLAPQPGQTVLDLCAAPGTKTTHLGELMQGRGSIVACDVDAKRLRLVAENARRLGIEIIDSRLVRADATDVPAGPFDAILVDAPCTNTGVLGRRPEARWRLKPGDLGELTAVQTRLLSAAAERLRTNGRLVYSTCSIEPEENEQLVRHVLRTGAPLSLVSELRHNPGDPADGGYQALLVRG
ncbi:MAG: class I SAM-dependent methyltransferase [Planctomycetes bacterium]|nr:class I SAM-dependent methyltransferase [Planctomycetota bacterium]